MDVYTESAGNGVRWSSLLNVKTEGMVRLLEFSSLDKNGRSHSVVEYVPVRVSSVVINKRLLNLFMCYRCYFYCFSPDLSDENPGGHVLLVFW